MRDFTISIYKTLLNALLSNEVKIQTFNDFIENPGKRSYILRHDVERSPENSLIFAKLQSDLDIKGTYYFRILPKSFNPKIIQEIAALGHEIGYHYETMATSNGDIDKAYEEFCQNLETFRTIVPVTTICMHGSPLSKYDNKEVWRKYDYSNHGIIGEPYLDINFNEMLYLTDTGRMWDGNRFSVRDKVYGSQNMEIRRQEFSVNSRQSVTYQQLQTKHQSPIAKLQLVTRNSQPETRITKHIFHSTKDIILAAQNKVLPSKIMFTFHPQRWTNNIVPWTNELIWQGVKNSVKGLIVKRG